MSEREDFAEELKRLSKEDCRVERLLASLAPHPARVNRDRLMFLAGRASALAEQQATTARRRLWLWPAATICSACLGLLIGVANPLPHRVPKGADHDQLPAADAGNPAAAREDSMVKTREWNEGFAEMSREVELEDERPTEQPLTLRALGDRLRAGQNVDLALAPSGGTAARGAPAPDSAPPADYRHLTQQWLKEQGANQL